MLGRDPATSTLELALELGGDLVQLAHRSAPDRAVAFSRHEKGAAGRNQLLSCQRAREGRVEPRRKTRCQLGLVALEAHVENGPVVRLA